MITSWLQVISCGCRMAFPVGYLLRASFFKTTFNFRHCHCCQVPPSIGRPVDRRYFNQEATSAIFSKNFLTNFFFGLLFGLSRCLPSVGHLFQDHSRTIMTFCLQNCLQCYEMAFFIGYQVEGCFSSVKVQKSSICSLTSE